MGAALLILVTGGVLLRTELHRRVALRRGMRYPPSRLLGDLRPFQDLLLEFLADSPPCHQLLANLATANRPLTARELFRQGRWSEETDGTAKMRFSGEQLLIAVSVLLLTGLIRLGRGGFSNTAAGYEVIRCLQRPSAVPRLQTAAPLQSEKSAPTWSRVRHPVALRKKGALRLEAPAMITAADYLELGAAIAAARRLTARVGKMRSLQDKLAQATIIRAGGVPPDLVTMNSQIEVVDLASSEQLNLTLVYPVEADTSAGRVSVFSSLGAALLGQREGQSCAWPVPYGVRRFRVNAVLFQPETALARVA